MKIKQNTYSMKAIARICITLLIACTILILLGNVYQTKAEAVNEFDSGYNLVIIPVNKSVDHINEKYWYIFQDTNLTYDIVKYIDEMSYQYNVNPHIMMGIYYIESNFTIDVDNTKSSARGLGQIINSTGKYVYEVLLDKGEYVHTMAYDPYINVQISIKLMQYNLNQTDGNMNLALQKYSGTTNDRYYNKLCNFINSYGINLDTVYYI